MSQPVEVRDDGEQYVILLPSFTPIIVPRTMEGEAKAQALADIFAWIAQDIHQSWTSTPDQDMVQFSQSRLTV